MCLETLPDHEHRHKKIILFSPLTSAEDTFRVRVKVTAPTLYLLCSRPGGKMLFIVYLWLAGLSRGVWHAAQTKTLPQLETAGEVQQKLQTENVFECSVTNVRRKKKQKEKKRVTGIN